MARTGINLGNSQFQVGARLKKSALVLALCLAFSATSADAATKKPTPTPTTKASVKASPKATVKPKPTAKATSNATSKPTVKAKAPTTAKPTASAQPTVSTKPKPKPRKKIRLTPSPKPKWPPVDFEFESGIYAKVPTSKELVSVISAKTNLASQVKACSEFVCGAVQVAAETGCVWWEVNSQVLSKEGVILGDLRTISTPSAVKEIKTILLISPEPIETLEYISNIEVICHQDPRPEGVSAATYTKVVE
ncbi:hypothetical protein [Candidatus Planktophila versatilis]|uniref:hypothetical protein n=1 Tax=Candidatus Planktophila versatilis TaxID=1884905 RepID=UPI001CBD8EF1|nr:hypothetical protein [Candidatus Planktophila versatilis]